MYSANTTSYAFCFLAGMGGVWSPHVEMHFVFSLACVEFGQHKLRYVFFLLKGFVQLWLTYIEVHFVSSLAFDVFGQHNFICILFPGWHGRGLITTCLDAFCVLAGIG